MAAYSRVYDSRHLQAVKNRDQSRSPTLGNREWATFTFYVRGGGVHAAVMTLRVSDVRRGLDWQVRPLDMAACAQTRSLYVSDAGNARLLRVDAGSGRVAASWRVDWRGAWGLSVTGRGTVLVCCRGAALLCEYEASTEHLLRQVPPSRFFNISYVLKNISNVSIAKTEKKR